MKRKNLLKKLKVIHVLVSTDMEAAELRIEELRTDIEFETKTSRPSTVGFCLVDAMGYPVLGSVKKEPGGYAEHENPVACIVKLT